MRKKPSSRYERALRLAQTENGSSTKIYDLLIAADREGDPRATYALATWYLHGKFVRKNIKLANKFLERAALQGIPDAAYNFAISLEKGKGVKKSARRAFEFYMRAAASGEPQSTYELGRMYYYGIGTAKNSRLANIWLGRAETLGVCRGK